jgi:N-acetylglutamate synthase-like GNAT family acetyltransferase
MVELRSATIADVPAIHRLICENIEVGHLLPRSLADVEQHVARFVIAEADGRVVGCAELAPLSPAVAEVRSLVVDEVFRGQRIGTSLVAHVSARAVSSGFATLSAFTHDPSHFVRLGFSIVPHVWVPEKIARDCTGCALFRRCGQHAVTLALRKGAVVRPERPAAMVHERGAAPRRPHIERLRILEAPAFEPAASAEPIPA